MPPEMFHFLVFVLMQTGTQAMGTHRDSLALHIPFDELNENIISATPNNFRIDRAADVEKGMMCNALALAEEPFCIKPTNFDSEACPYNPQACTNGMTLSLWLQFHEETTTSILVTSEAFIISFQYMEGLFIVTIQAFEAHKSTNCNVPMENGLNWLQFVVVYNAAKEISLFVNGTEMSSCSYAVIDPETELEFFNFGCLFGVEGKFLMDEFQLYKEGFTSHDVTELFKREVEEITELCPEKEMEEMHKDHIRLTGGPSNCTGRAEIFMNGTWGTVCTIGSSKTGWPYSFCKTLGCGEVLEKSNCKKKYCIPEDERPIHLVGPRCRGRKVDDFFKCDLSNRDTMGCGHDRDAWLSCAQV